MRIVKTYEAFWKKKISADDQILLDYIKRLENLKKYLEKGNVSPYEISANNSIEDDSSMLRYRFVFDDSPIRIVSAVCSKRFRLGWNEETQNRWIESGVIRKNNHVFYAVYVELEDDATVQGDVELLEKLFNLAEWCFNKNRQNKRTSSIKNTMNPAADLLDDSIYGELPIDRR